jgi:tetratricopeptide (TPR) repeat protein
MDSKELLMMKTIIATSLLALFCLATAAQKIEPPRLEPTPSTENQEKLINEGVILHDKGDYDGAIRRYEQVLRENPNNIGAIYEMAYSYFMKKDYRKSLEMAYRGTQYKSNLLPQLYVQIGNCWDELGEPKTSVETYKSALKLYPSSFLVHYNLAVTYSRIGQIDDARASVKKSAFLNPNHPSSQLLLSTLFDKGSYKIPSLLAACRFLILEPNSRRSDTALALVRKIMQAGVSKGKTPNEVNVTVEMGTNKKDEGDFTGMETFMGLAKAADYIEENKGKSEMQLLVGNFESLFAFLSESPHKPDWSKFTWKYYVPYFLEMKKQSYIDAFVYHINQRSPVAGMSEWQKQNPTRVSDFLAWSKSYPWPKE